MTKVTFPYIDKLGNQVNDQKGAMISSILQKGREKRAEIRYLFTQFIQANGYVAWHIENGWFSSGGKFIGSDINDRLHYSYLSFTWYTDFYGAFGGNIPKEGELMVVIDPHNPENSAERPGTVFKVHCYKVTSVRKYGDDGFYQKGAPNYSISMDKIGYELAYFDRKEGYKFYVSDWTKFKTWLNKIFKKK